MSDFIGTLARQQEGRTWSWPFPLDGVRKAVTAMAAARSSILATRDCGMIALGEAGSGQRREGTARFAQ